MTMIRFSGNRAFPYLGSRTKIEYKDCSSFLSLSLPAPQTMSDPLTINFHPVISPTGIIHVLGYTPTEGERGVPITVRIHFHPDLADAMYVRLVVGNKAVPTRVCQLHGTTYGRWQLHAAAPPFDRLQFPSTKVLISIQALNEDNAILDSVTFGEFSYWAPGIFSFFFSLFSWSHYLF
jgi:hypothetical protein